LANTIQITDKNGRVHSYDLPDFGEYRFIIQNGAVHRIEKTESEILKNK